MTCEPYMAPAAEATTRNSDIVLMDARGLADAITSRALSCVEVMNAYLDHIENLNSNVNAIVALQDRNVLTALAKQLDAEVARGQIVGPLHGFPFAVKTFSRSRAYDPLRGRRYSRNLSRHGIPFRSRAFGRPVQSLLERPTCPNLVWARTLQQGLWEYAQCL